MKNPLHGVERPSEMVYRVHLYPMLPLRIHYMELKAVFHGGSEKTGAVVLNPLHGVERPVGFLDSTCSRNLLNPLHGVERQHYLGEVHGGRPNLCESITWS